MTILATSTFTIDVADIILATSTFTIDVAKNQFKKNNDAKQGCSTVQWRVEPYVQY
jgi:expansin (peptidoglycan-binding protein)